ncbi:uncharacterized protein ACRADG_010072 [Cochliomyia hominivorax]
MILTSLLTLSSILLFLQPTTSAVTGYDNYLYEYISAFPYMQAMHDTIWFISQQLDGEQIARTNQLINYFRNFKQLSFFVWTKPSEVRMINIQSKRAYIGVLITTGPKDPIMKVHHDILIGRHYNLNFVIYMGKVDNAMEPIKELCYMIYQGNFANSVVYFKTSLGQVMVYSIQMYPEFKIINSTNYAQYYKDMNKAISSASQDVKGYKFRTPLKEDIPSVFEFKDIQGRKQIQGISYSLLKTFTNSINGTLEAYENQTKDKEEGLSKIVNMKEVIDLIRLKKIDISAHAYALFHSNNEVDKSYPLMVVKWCLMIPLRNSISTFFYTLQPFEGKTWMLALVAFAAMCYRDYLNHRYKIYWATVKINWLNNVCHLINISPTQSITSSNLQGFLYYCCIFIFGFFLSALYTSFLGSSLTVNLFIDQINSLQDLINANQTVMIIDYELEFLLSEGYSISPEFMQLLQPENPSTFYKHQMALNTTFAYFVTEDRWQFLEESQHRLKQKLFKFSDICFGSYHLAYPMYPDSPIWRDLEYFIFYLHSSGLFHKYERRAVNYAFKGEYLKRLEKTESYATVGWDHLKVIFFFLISMHVIAFACLVGEILYYNW